MRRISFLAAAAAALAMVSCADRAHAVFLNPNGQGQVLVYPYYTVSEGQDTLLTVVNTGEAKAVKIRFLEGYNSRDVLDINLYLAEGDVWTGAVVASGDGAALLTSDSSCTVPQVPQLGSPPLAFSARAFDGSGPQGKDGGPATLARTREGHIEVIEMGTLLGASNAAVSHQPPRSSTEMVYSGGSPSDCGKIRNAWASGGYWAMDASVDLDPPTGGLIGTASIVNVGLGTAQSYVADALAEFYEAETGRIHTEPNALTPNIASGTSLTSLTYPSSSPFSATFTRGIDAVSSVFMAASLINEFWTAQGLDAKSEWVVTYPTKRFYTDPYYVSGVAEPPFNINLVSESVVPGATCTVVGEELRDRSQSFITNFLAGLTPWMESTPMFCYATQVVTFNGGAATGIHDHRPSIPSALLGSRLVSANFNASFENGWAKIYLNDYLFSSPDAGLMSMDGARFAGQPVTGFLVAQFVNGDVQGALANYSMAFRHRAQAFCRKETANGPVLCRNPPASGQLSPR